MTIKFIGSPNFDSNQAAIKQVVIHWIVGDLASADAQFQKPNGTSAHYGVEDDTIHQYVLERNVAYAVGVYARNQETISIEHSASPERAASDKTYETSGKLIAEICRRNNLPIDRAHIIGHNEIKSTQCPGTMDIDRLIRIAQSQNEQMATITQRELDIIRTDRDNNWNMFVALCDGLGTQHNKEVALEEIAKLIKVEDLLTDKQKELTDATANMEKLEEQVKKLKATSDTLTTASKDMTLQLSKQNETIEDQKRDIVTLTTQLDELKKDAEFSTLSGWKRGILRFLLRI